MLSLSEFDDDVAPAFTTRRERRAAERLALHEAVVPVPEPASPEVPAVLEVPVALAPPIAFAKPAGAPAAEPRRAVHPKRARTRKRAFARGLFSIGAMTFAAALAVGMTLPSNVFGSPAPVIASELPPGMNATVELKQALDVNDNVIAAEAPSARDDYASQSFADVERARYQASGQGFAPGFVPTAGAIRWPFDHSVPITSGFGYSVEYGGDHSGIDFIPGMGAPVGAIADGVVLWVGWDGTGYGYYVKIQSQVGEHTITAIYAHFIDGSSPMYPGQLIKVGDVVGLTGDTGIAYGAHLHLGIEQDGVLIDPFQWLTEHATDAPAP